MSKLGRKLSPLMAADNPPDAVTLDIPTMIRILEWAREDSSNDVQLHVVAENLTKLSASGKTLTMDDYGDILEGTEK